MRAPVSLAKRYVSDRMLTYAPLTVLLASVAGVPAVFPGLAPAEEITLPHITHAHVAWQTTTTLSGAPVSWEALFDVSLWAPGWDDQVLLEPEAEMLVALFGADLAGSEEHFVAGPASAFVTIKIQDPVPTSGDWEATGAWQRVTHRLKLTLA